VRKALSGVCENYCAIGNYWHTVRILKIYKLNTSSSGSRKILGDSKGNDGAGTKVAS
jgi:hypothetical protein